MNRRSLLRGALGLGALPALLSGASAWASGDSEQQRAALSASFQSAAQAERPLLVLVIPADDGEKWVRGQALGEWLNAAEDAALATLAQVEVVCAAMADLQRLVPGLALEAKPWFVLVQTLGGAEATGVRVELPKPPPGRPEFGDKDYYGQAREDWAVKKVQVNTAAIEAALLPVILASTGPVPPAQRALLAERARRALVSAAPAGAHWARSGGCGTTIEGVEQQYAVDCGMGHVPAATRRFLYLHDVSSFQGR